MTEKLIEKYAEMRIKPYRKDSEYSYTCGVFPTIELLKRKPQYVIRVAMSSESDKSRGSDIVRELAKENGIPVVTDDKTIERIAAKDNCLCAGVFLKYEEEIRQDTDHIVLVNPSDMGNIGTIIRTSSAFGFEDLAVITPACDIFDPKAVRASMGAIFGIRVKLFASFEEYLKTPHRGSQRHIYPFMLKGEKLTRQIADEAVTMSKEGEHFTLVFGNESRGLDDSYLDIGKPLLIPIRDTVDSLNLPVAVSIGEYMFSAKGEKK